MNRVTAKRLVLAAALAASLGGCASFHHFAQWVRIKPVAPASLGARPSNRVDSYYASAKAAIARRDYADALELLQAAREQKADDFRVLNAFGVVYDKLGRFDLSERYYAQAKTLDPASAILVNNIAYSKALRLGAALSPLDAAPIQLARADTDQVASPIEPARPSVIRLGFARPSATNLALAGKPLEVANASGRKDGAVPVVRALVRLGWTTPNVSVAAARREARSTIQYPTSGLTVANALARTLPAGVQLVDCGACDGLRLVLGADSGAWPIVARAGHDARGE